MMKGALAKADEPDRDLRCPACDSLALYRYGRSWAGKRRYLCLICSRQFTVPGPRERLVDRPVCASCGRLMNVYRKEADLIRFRCSAYPECRTYFKKKV